MNSSRERPELFVFAFGVLLLVAATFYAARNGGAVIMSAMCAAGLVAGRAAGFSNRSLVPLALGLAFVLVIVWGEVLPLDSQATSAVAHGTGGLLVGWAISEYLRDRYIWALWPLGVLASVFVLGVVWEVFEYLGDRAFGTALVPKMEDSIKDVAFGTLGGVVGMLLSLVFPPRSHRS